MKLLQIFMLIFCLNSLSGCLSSKITIDLKKRPTQFTTTKTITSVSVINNQIKITGSGLAEVTSLKIQNNNLNETFTIESASATQIIANSTHAVAVGVGQIFDLIISNTEGSATFPVTFSLDDGSVTAAKLSSMGATTGQVLKYNGTAWVPTSLAASQLYIGTWNATTNMPDPNAASLQSGDYYIVSVPGTYDLGGGATTYAIGDWILYNGSSWDKISNSANLVSSFKGRTGLVFPATGDYTWAQITKTTSKLEDIADINIAGRADGKVLKWDAGSSKWILGNDNDAALGVGSITTSQIMDGTIVNADISATAAIAQSKITNLTTDLAAKEPAITAATTTKYFRGDKTFVTLDTNVVTENTNLYFTNARALGVPLTGYVVGANSAIAATDTILGAIQKMQGQLNAKVATGTFIDWSVSGVQTIDLSRLNLGVAAASKALVTNASGFIVSSGSTATEVGYLSGTTSAIQTQLNAKQATIDKTTVQPVSTIRIFGANTTNYVELSVPVLAGNTTYKFPAAYGTAGQVLTTDVSGNLSWSANGGGGGGAPSGAAGGDLSGTYPNPTISALDAAKIGGGTVSNTEYSYIDGVTSAIQTQLNAKEPTITAGTTAQYLRGDKSLSSFASDVLATVLTGISTATNAVITATDTVLTGMGKLQKQITDLGTGKLDKTGGALSVGTISGVPTPTNSDDVANKGYVDGYGKWTNGTGGNVADIYRSTGNVGIGTANPRAGLDVSTGSAIGKAAVLNASTTIDFGTGNLQYTLANCQAFVLNNLKDGGSYAFIVKGAADTTCSFTAYSDVATTALTVHMPTDHSTTIANKHTMYNYMVFGGDVYISWVPGL